MNLNIWDTLVVNPLAALLLFLYNMVRNYGVAMILFCLITKIILLYFTARGKASMMRRQRLVPKERELERLHGKDKQKYNEALMQMYQEEGVSPMGGCLWSMLPIPIFFALYSVVRQPLTNLMKLASEQITEIADVLQVTATGNEAFFLEMNLAQKIYENYDLVVERLPHLADKLLRINFDLFPGFNLAPTPNLPWQEGGWNWLLIVPLLSCATAYLSTFLSQKINGTGDQMKGVSRAMFMMMPLFSLWIGFTTPAAMGVYWTANNLFTIVQDYYLTGYYKKKMAAEDAHKAELAARRKAAEELMREEERQRRLEQGAGALKNTSRKKQYRLKNLPKDGPKDGKQ